MLLAFFGAQIECLFSSSSSSASVLLGGLPQPPSPAVQQAGEGVCKAGYACVKVYISTSTILRGRPSPTHWLCTYGRLMILVNRSTLHVFNTEDIGQGVAQACRMSPDLFSNCSY